MLEIVLARYQSSNNCLAPVFPKIKLLKLLKIKTIKNGIYHFQSRKLPIYQQNLGWSGNSEIPDHPGFSRHMKTSLKWTLFLVPRVSSNGRFSCTLNASLSMNF